MKKVYMKPDAEYIVLMSQEALANEVGDDEDVEIGTSNGEDDWV